MGSFGREHAQLRHVHHADSNSFSSSYNCEPSLREFFFSSLADRSLCTKGSLFRTLLSSQTQAYLSSLTLKCHVDMTLQPCVNSEEKGTSVGSNHCLCLGEENASRCCCVYVCILHLMEWKS